MTLFELTPLYGLEPHIRKIKENWIKHPLALQNNHLSVSEPGSLHPKCTSIQWTMNMSIVLGPVCIFFLHTKTNTCACVLHVDFCTICTLTYTGCTTFEAIARGAQTRNTVPRVLYWGLRWPNAVQHASDSPLCGCLSCGWYWRLSLLVLSFVISLTSSSFVALSSASQSLTTQIQVSNYGLNF